MAVSLTNRQLGKRPLYREEVRGIILDLIISGKLQPGDRVVETRLAKELGVSQAPIREAIRELEMLNLVENIPYKGAYVCRITPGDIRDAYRVRKVLESSGIADAVGRISEREIAEAHRLFHAMRECAAGGDYHRYISYDTLFHKHFMDLSPNGMLRRLWSQCSIPGSTQIGTHFSGHALLTLADRHIGICRALERRDEAMARQAVEDHFQLLIEDLEQSNASIT